MKLLFIALNTIINIFLASFYVLISIIFGNFLYWFILSNFLWKEVPWPQDSIHIKIALLASFLILVISILLRKYLYLSVLENFKTYILNKQSGNKNNLKKVEPKKNNNTKNQDDLEIYVNKEIK